VSHRSDADPAIDQTDAYAPVPAAMNHPELRPIKIPPLPTRISPAPFIAGTSRRALQPPDPSARCRRSGQKKSIIGKLAQLEDPLPALPSPARVLLIAANKASFPYLSPKGLRPTVE